MAEKRIFVFLALSAVLVMSGCVDVNQPNVGTMDFRSLARLVNLAKGTSMSVTIDGTSIVSALAYGNASNYFDLPAGYRKFVFSYGGIVDSVSQSLASEWKYSIFSIYDPGAGDVARTYVFATERYTFDTELPANTARVRFLQFSSDTSQAIRNGLTMTLSYGSRDTVFQGLKFKSITPYVDILTSSFPVRYTIVDAAGDTLANHADAQVVGAGRYSIVVYGSKTGFQKNVFKED